MTDQNISNPINISIIIPVFDNVDGLKTTLNSLFMVLGNRKDIEVLICNDGGGDNISRIIARYGAIEVKSHENKGSYAARNLGIQSSRADVLVFLDADQQVTEQWLEAGLKSLLEGDYVGGQIIIDSGKNPSDWELLDALTAFPTERLRFAHYAPTANLFVRRRVFEKLGKFNELLKSAGDFEFGSRVFNAGYKQVYASEAITIHPARSRREQFRKVKRVASGYVDVACIINNKKPILILLYALGRFSLIPIEIFFRFSQKAFRFRRDNNLNLKFIFMLQLRKSIYFWHVISRSGYYLKHGTFDAKSNRL